MPYSKYSNNSDCRTVVVTVAVIMRIVYILCMCEGRYTITLMCVRILKYSKRILSSQKRNEKQLFS